MMDTTDSAPPSAEGLRKRSHPWIDARSLELARATAATIRLDTTLMRKAHDNLTRWKARHDPWPPAWEEWERILAEHDLERVLEILVEDSEAGRRRRQSSPFAGVLPESERRAIFRHYEEIGSRARSPRRERDH